jgi:hypothetical protein
MRLRIDSIALSNTSRRVSFEPGLNVITGPIASGKTTLFRFIRSILGGSLDNLTPEARTVTAVLGEIVIGDTNYSIVRPVVTTRTARVDIASKNMATRLPIAQLDSEAHQTYLQWLLEKLGLPYLQVPSAPTKPESEPTPVSIRDYLSYCTLTQDEIGEEIFSHKDYIKNIKRKYVFEIIYGIYNVETAQIQDKLRDVQVKLRELKNQGTLFSLFLKDTVLENRAEIERKLNTAITDLENIESVIDQKHNELGVSSQSEQLQRSVLSIESDVQHISAEIESETRSIDDIKRLSLQLETQASRVTRSIVAEKHLADIDFIVCPRCGSQVTYDRANGEVCYLCLQAIKPEGGRQSLIEEQARIEAQLQEAQELLVARENNVALLKKELVKKQAEESRIKQELDFQTRTFVSSSASQIASLAASRAELKLEVDKYTEYSRIFQKLDQAQRQVEDLEREKVELEQQLEASLGKEEVVKERINYLNDQYNDILEAFYPPEFGERNSIIDRNTYLPEYHGRRFDEISSPGLATLVSIAYLLAHQRTSIHLNLGLPNILLIDGLSEHLGKEGFDPKRQEAVYKYIIQMSEELGDIFQVIIVDNEVPSIARRFVRLELSESERLIPIEQNTH